MGIGAENISLSLGGDINYASQLSQGELAFLPFSFLNLMGLKL